MGRRRRMFSASGAVVCGGVFAILLWGKLKLVTGAPRTAFATDPAAVDPAGPSGHGPGSLDPSSPDRSSPDPEPTEPAPADSGAV